MVASPIAATSFLTSREDAEKKRQLGQFFTPKPMASLLASFVSESNSDIRMLDAGAGSGALIEAMIWRFCSANRPPARFVVDAWEVDGAAIPSLRKTLDECERRCAVAGIAFEATLHHADFIEAAVSRVRSDWFDARGAGYTLALLNPPYRKIRADSRERKMLHSVGIETSNLYTAFVSLAARLLEPGGELVAITPRSFCNGPYFRPFREDFLARLTLHRVHVFESRSAAFRSDDVLQENVIICATRGASQAGPVLISSSSGERGAAIRERIVTYAEVVSPQDKERFIRLPSEETFDDAAKAMAQLPATLADLGLSVSTGRVVDFRARDFLRASADSETAPLIYPSHFDAGLVRWPRNDSRKPNAIVNCVETSDLLVPGGIYVLVKRFTAKEERRRVVASIYDSARVAGGPVGFENHLNYFHLRGMGLEMRLARGLSAFLNSTVLDNYFRIFSGHTQVNATDLRALRFPSLSRLVALGERVPSFAIQRLIDTAVEEIAFA